jgi:chromosome segregation ATPase
MTKFSVWKRVGGWLRRSHEPVKEGKLERLDAEGMLVDTSEDTDQENSSVLVTRSNKKDRQLAALEDGFGRLVEVLESINDNVIRQQEQNVELKSSMEKVADSLHSLPGSGESTQAVKELTEELHGQSLRHQQVAEIIKSLPELTRTQVDKLDNIDRHLEASADADVQIVESFNRLGNSVQSLQDNSSTQTKALHYIQEVNQRSSEQMARMLAKQNRRMMIMLVIISLFALAAIAAALVIFMQMGGNPGS